MYFSTFQRNLMFGRVINVFALNFLKKVALFRAFLTQLICNFLDPGDGFLQRVLF